MVGLVHFFKSLPTFSREFLLPERVPNLLITVNSVLYLPFYYSSDSAKLFKLLQCRRCWELPAVSLGHHEPVGPQLPPGRAGHSELSSVITHQWIPSAVGGKGTKR